MAIANGTSLSAAVTYAHAENTSMSLLADYTAENCQCVQVLQWVFNILRNFDARIPKCCAQSDHDQPLDSSLPNI